MLRHQGSERATQMPAPRRRYYGRSFPRLGLPSLRFTGMKVFPVPSTMAPVMSVLSGSTNINPSLGPPTPAM